MKEYKMGEICSMNGEDGNSYKSLFGKLQASMEETS
jgi:hypothetical protein